MATVTVDLTDLEALVMTTGVIKTFESLLAQRRMDPFVRPYLEFTEAHERLAAVMRDAKREDAGTKIKYNDPLTEKEAELLHHIGEGKSFLTPKEKVKVADGLAAKGLIIIGQMVFGVVWPGASAAELKADPTEFAVKLTARGLKALDQKQLALSV